MTDEPVASEEDLGMVDTVAKALYMHAVKQAREQIAAEVLPIERIVAVFEDAIIASDREAAIVIFCLVDDLATDFFRRKLTGKVNSGVDEMFLTGNGMLATAYNKIALLTGLEWIRNETYRSLTLMRKIRNEFAHHVEYKSFEDQPICSYIDSMDAREQPVLDTLDADRRPKKILIRSKFLVRSSITVLHLLRDLTFIQAAINHRIHPGSVTTSFDDEPENIKILARTISRIVLEILLSQPSQAVLPS